jgi:hypothetical protein
MDKLYPYVMPRMDKNCLSGHKSCPQDHYPQRLKPQVRHFSQPLSEIRLQFP